GMTAMAACSSGAVGIDLPVGVACSAAEPCPESFACSNSVCVKIDLILRPLDVTELDRSLQDHRSLDLARLDLAVLPDVTDLAATSDQSPPMDLAPDSPMAPDLPAPTCPAPVDCTNSLCDGASCGTHGQLCQGGACICPGGQAKETSCGD